MTKNFDTYLIHSDGRETKMAETWTEQEAIDAADMAVSGRVDCRAVVYRTDSSALAPALYEVASAPQAEAAAKIKNSEVTKAIQAYASKYGFSASSVRTCSRLRYGAIAEYKLACQIERPQAEPATAPIIAGITKEIRYCRATRDYDLYVTIDGGEPLYIGSAADYQQGEILTDQYVFDYLTDTHTIETAAELLMELPAGAFGGECPDCGPIRIRIPRGTEIVQQATGKTTEATHTFMVVAERDRQSGCMLFAMPSRGLCYVAEGWVRA